MRFPSTLFTLAALAVLSTPAMAQAAPASIDPGMSKAQVIERFGKPASERSRGEYTYLFFANGMEKQVGMSDIVILQSDKVVDAVLRSPKHAYTGTSSSPRARTSKEAKQANPKPLKIGG
jgi:outer membrane protein assembly factor BamE (lipoprotein component of BamABCDE complex)